MERIPYSVEKLGEDNRIPTSMFRVSGFGNLSIKFPWNSSLIETKKRKFDGWSAWNSTIPGYYIVQHHAASAPKDLTFWWQAAGNGTRK